MDFFLPELREKALRFGATHPMFRLDVSDAPADFIKRLRDSKKIVVMGFGGSVLPLKAFVDFFRLEDSVQIFSCVDQKKFDAVAKSDATLVLVSKSGSTLEIEALKEEILRQNLLKRLLIVCGEEKNVLRDWATQNEIPTCPIPSNLGGRFTNWSAFHKALLESRAVTFSDLLGGAREMLDKLQKDSGILERFFSLCFEKKVSKFILWFYGEEFRGFSQWLQQILAESLGKISKTTQRVGIFPVILEGPADQHSVLQFLMEGPQDSALFFIGPDKKVTPKNLSLENVETLFFESIFESFKERVREPQTQQPVGRLKISETAKDFGAAILFFQAFIEYAGERLNINAFDQPGVERGKQIARKFLG